ncbi:MAG: glutamate--cysteine ligase, partial [Congregibacter sp.]|nr:glutamate--cysteine ligase [Congregibacter sp.]
LEPFDGEGNTLHLPYATALRMGDLGYNSSAQKSLRACYNSLDNYIATLTHAILTPHPDYAAFKGMQDGEYMQLNDSLLQIENEFYSSIRPKRPGSSAETPLSALHKRGIEYVEVRCIDVSPFHPLGIDSTQIRLLDSFLLYCLTQPSPVCDELEQGRQSANLTAIVNRGREPGLMLETAEGQQALSDWATELLDAVSSCAQMLDSVHASTAYTQAVDEQQAKVRGEIELPSARVLREMREQGIPYYRFAMGYSKRWAEHFRERKLDAQTQQALEQETTSSLLRQADVEAADSCSFEEYLSAYFDQYKALNHGE